MAGFGEAGEDLLEAQVFDRVGAEEVGVFGDHGGADLFRVAVGGQVGAGVEDLAAAGRDGDEAVEGDGVADRPGRDDDDQAEGDDDAREQRALASSVRGAFALPLGFCEPRGREAKRSWRKTSTARRSPIARYSGRTRASAPRVSPGTSQRQARDGPAAGPSSPAAQRIARIAPLSSVAASGSVISIPVYSIVAG